MIKRLRAWIYTIARRQLADFKLPSERAQLRALNRLGVQRRSLTVAEYERIEELASTPGAARDGGLRRSAGFQRINARAVRLRVICEENYESIKPASWASARTPHVPASVEEYGRCGLPCRLRTTKRFLIWIGASTVPETRETFDGLPILRELRDALDGAAYRRCRKHWRC